MKPSKKVTINGNRFGKNQPGHPDYNPNRKPYTWKNPPPKSPNSIPYQHWDFLVGWIPSQIREGNPLDRRTLANLCEVQERTVALQKWLHAIHDHWQGQFEWEVDPNYNAKRGAKIKRLVPRK